MSDLLNKFFSACEEIGASDIHLSAGESPRLRSGGTLSALPGDALSAAELEQIARFLASSSAADFSPSSAEALDGAISSPAGKRYRFNIFREMRGLGIALRRLDDRFRSLQELGLPEALGAFTTLTDGLVVITGPTGSGKSTTLATLLDGINRLRSGHIITIEDPIEYVHKSQACLVQQRQIGRDARSFNSALVEALRQDPDVILVGEIRELETIRTAITAAETGHLVFTTLHAGDCVGAVERLVSVFPADEQFSIRRQLSLTLRGILAQHLLPARTPGASRVVCSELMFVSAAIANQIANGKSNQIYSAIETGRALGMQTLESDLARLVLEAKISEQTACAIAKNPDALRAHIRSGVR